MKHLSEQQPVTSRKYFYRVENIVTPVADNPVLCVKPVTERTHGFARLFMSQCFSKGYADRLQIFSTDFIDQDFVDACVGLTRARVEGRAWKLKLSFLMLVTQFNCCFFFLFMVLSLFCSSVAGSHGWWGHLILEFLCFSRSDCIFGGNFWFGNKQWFVLWCHVNANSIVFNFYLHSFHFIFVVRTLFKTVTRMTTEEITLILVERDRKVPDIKFVSSWFCPSKNCRRALQSFALCWPRCFLWLVLLQEWNNGMPCSTRYTRN